MNFNQQLQEAYEAGYYRALNESVAPVEYEQSPVTPTGAPDLDQMTPAQQQEYQKYQEEQKQRELQRKMREIWQRHMDREKKLRPVPTYTPAGPRPTRNLYETDWHYQKRLRDWQRLRGDGYQWH